jgi:hypothetical protein
MVALMSVRRTAKTGDGLLCVRFAPTDKRTGHNDVKKHHAKLSSRSGKGIMTQ